MPLTYQVASLNMEWCLECHRNPEKFIRPKKEVFTMNWPPEEWEQSADKKWHQEVEGDKTMAELIKLKGIDRSSDENSGQNTRDRSSIVDPPSSTLDPPSSIL